MRRFVTCSVVLAAFALGCADAKACCWYSPCWYSYPAPVTYSYSCAAPAWLYITVPDGAKLSFDGTATQQTSGTWAWWTPPLLFGFEYKYVLKAGKDGEPRNVTVRAGEVRRVDLTKKSEQRTAESSASGGTEATGDGNPPTSGSSSRGSSGSGTAGSKTTPGSGSAEGSAAGQLPGGGPGPQLKAVSPPGKKNKGPEE